jgi:quercetin dioxygenase-like cupin family protein
LKKANRRIIGAQSGAKLLGKSNNVLSKYVVDFLHRVIFTQELKMNKLIIRTGIVAGFAALTVAGYVVAQQAGFTRTAIQTQDLSIPGRNAVQVRAEFDPGVAAGRHTHPGEELSYLLEGQIELRVDGQPPRIIKAGESFFVPAGVVHDGVNTGTGKAKVFATYIVEKGKPLASPAP